MMPTFADKDGKAWQVSLTVGHLAPLKAFHLDLNQLLRSDEAWASLFTADPQDKVAALYEVCREQIEKAGVTPEGWAYLFDGPTLERATVALAEAVIDFFPRQRIAQAMRGNLRRALERMDREIAARIDAGQGPTSNGAAGNSPASSASTPAPSPSGNST
jgi:hypothetical protein